jgi:nondiscriminating aspartyl-tRNA synthetase
MEATTPKRAFIKDLSRSLDQDVVIRGWVHHLRVLARTTFIIVRDCSGEAQCVVPSESTRDLHLKLDDAVEVQGRVRPDPRAKAGYEIDVLHTRVLGRASNMLPFNGSSNISAVGFETLIDYRPLALRNDRVGDVFRIQAAILRYFREFLSRNLFTEIVTSKIVASGTEGGSNLFPLKYFDRVAYLAQSPQFYKEHGVAGLERVYETGHVYRAEPHASSRHLTEYYSLDFELGFIDGPEEVMQVERELLTFIFERLNEEFGSVLARFRSQLLQVAEGKPDSSKLSEPPQEVTAGKGVPARPRAPSAPLLGQRSQLPSLLETACWEFERCLDLLRDHFGRTDLTDDLDPEGERQLCALAEKETGIPALFVVGFPLASRPFYTAPRGTAGAAQSFDLLFQGVEITTGGQRLHRREDLEAALRARGMDPADFESHLKMFELGMPPHGGLAIGLERLTAQVLCLSNVREAVLYPRDRYRVTP